MRNQLFFEKFISRINNWHCTKNEVFPLGFLQYMCPDSQKSCKFGHTYWINLYWKTLFFVQCDFHADTSNFKFLRFLLVCIYLFKIYHRNTRKRGELCSKLTTRHQNNIIDFALMSLLLTLNIIHTFFYCLYCWL